MTLTLGFDVYGTLIDTHGVIVELEKIIGEEAPRFSQLWRDKQLEYTWRRSVMGKYRDFAVCTRDALEYTRQFMHCEFSDDQRQTLLSAYATLPAFADVATSLEAIRAGGHKMYAFSNGLGAGVDTVITNAGIRDYFDGVVTVDDIGIFKPSPKTYEYFVASTEATMGTAWLVSSNGFDVMGAVASGMQAAWIQRSKAVVFDPWDEFPPTVILDTLAKLPAAIES